MTSVRPDGLVGALMAAEGFEGVETVLHGPGGCRFRYMRLAQELYPRDGALSCPRDRAFYFGSPRIPCTFLDEDDYIYGGSYNLAEALEEVAKGGSRMIVIESPATALIGDDIQGCISGHGLEGRAMPFRKHLVSMPMNEGFDELCREYVEFLSPRKEEKIPGTVNLLGLPILCRDWKGSLEEVSRILGMMGLRVTSSIGSGCSYEDVMRSSTAEFDISVFPEFCVSTAELYRDRFGIECNSCCFAPVGFDATKEWIGAVADLTGKDPSDALEYVRRTDMEARRILRSDPIKASKTRGMHYCIDAGSSVAYPLVGWLFKYLSMIPDSVRMPYGTDEARRKTEGMLESLHLSSALDAPLENGGLMASSGDYANMCRLSGMFVRSLDLGFPQSRGFHFNNGTILGPRGAMNILSSIYNV
ncbi:MAG: hypothetical protein IKH98_00345 [Candidatus Methanomethylophilaceae archaeon]|nr:hypothetical protein [Candidatus Methanomethylophilaceae archaeon]